MAPEQLEDNQVGPSADLWSLGIVLLECLTGRRAYEGSPSEIVARRLVAPVPIPLDLPVPWKLVLTGMLDHRPDQRLTGHQVAAMLATSAFQAPWQSSSDDTIVSRERLVPYDLTALAPASGASRHDDTIVAGADSTRISRPSATRPGSNAPKRGFRQARTAFSGLVVIALIGVGLGLWLTSGGHHDPKKTSAHDDHLAERVDRAVFAGERHGSRSVRRSHEYEIRAVNRHQRRTGSR